MLLTVRALGSFLNDVTKINPRKCNLIFHLCHYAVILYLNLLSCIQSNLKTTLWCTHMWQKWSTLSRHVRLRESGVCIQSPTLQKSSFSAEQLKSTSFEQKLQAWLFKCMYMCIHTDMISLRNTYQCDHSWWCTTAEFSSNGVPPL